MIWERSRKILALLLLLMIVSCLFAVNDVGRRESNTSSEAGVAGGYFGTVRYLKTALGMFNVALEHYVS